MRCIGLFLTSIIVVGSCSKKESTKNDQNLQNAKKLYDSSFIYLDKNDNQKAYLNLSKAKDIFQKEEDSFSVAKCLVNMAIIQEEESDNLGSIETSLAATKFLNKKNKNQFSFISSNYNNLGVASNSLKNYKEAKIFYDQALEFAKDTLDVLMVKNNQATSYHSQKKFANATNIYKDLLKDLHSKDEVYYKILVNYSRSAWMADAKFNPQSYFLEALRYYEKNNDKWGLDAVYCYFTEYYFDKNVDSTKLYAKKMLDVAKDLKAPTDQLLALDHLIKTENEKQSKIYFTEYKKLSDSISDVQNSTKNQFALIRFESEKNKADNLRLEKNIQQKEYIMYSGLFLLFVSVFAGYSWYKKRKTRIELKAQNQIKEERLLTSKKVHDVVANGLYQVMSSLEHAEDVDKEDVLEQLDGMYQKSRDISYDNFTHPEIQNFKEKFSELASHFQSETTNIFMVGNDEVFWDKITDRLSENLYLIIRELFVNMKKHSNASRVILKFENSSNTINILYKDNGVGNEGAKDKNGLTGIRERVAEYHGKLSFENDEGFVVKISFNI